MRAKILVVAGVVVLTCWFARAPILSTAASWLDVGESPEPVDFVYVLNGDLNSRPFIGAALLKADYAPKALLVPMKEPPKRESDPTPPTHEIARQVMLHRGVAPGSIEIIDGLAASTFDEASSLKKYLRATDKETSTVAVVTSDFHTRRTRWIFRRVLGSQSDKLRFVSAPTDGFDASNWWRVEEGFMTYGSEFLKFGFYVFWYGDGFLVTGGMIFAVVMAIALIRAKKQQGRQVDVAAA